MENGITKSSHNEIQVDHVIYLQFLSQHGIYFVTAGTLHKCHLFDTPAKLDLVEGMLLSLAKAKHWQLEAWAVLVNHYHFVARGRPKASNRSFCAKTAAPPA